METRCSILSAERDEPMIGTGFAQAGLLLVEQPGAWGRTGLAESDFDRDVARELEKRADEADLKLLAIRRSERSAPGRRKWAVRPAGATHTSWSEYDDDADLLDVPLDGSAGRPGDEPSYLVCTHAKRDQCCAVFARPLAAALERLRPGQVWGCSHTGGHRFAPVVVAVPAGTAGNAVYGRVHEHDLLALVAATEVGEVLPARLRGISGHPPYVQAAMAHLQGEVGGTGFEDWTNAITTRATPSRWEVVLTGPGGERRTLVDAVDRPEPMVSCGKPEPSVQTHYAVSSA